MTVPPRMPAYLSGGADLSDAAVLSSRVWVQDPADRLDDQTTEGTRMKRPYISGPMTGIRSFNFPAFDAEEDRLRAGGKDPISPARLDAPEVRERALASPDGQLDTFEQDTGETRESLLARDVRLIREEADAMVMLPGWIHSLGAVVEVIAARLVGLPFFIRVSQQDGALLMPIENPLRSVAPNHLYDAMEVCGKLLLPQLDERAEEAVPPPGDFGEVRVVNAATGGEKGSKPQRFDLMPYDALARIAEVFGWGATKYSDHNWRRGYDWSLSFAAMQRHMASWWEGEDLDVESGLSHVAHAAWHTLALLTFIAEHPQLDNRFIVQREALVGPSTADSHSAVPAASLAAPAAVGLDLAAGGTPSADLADFDADEYTAAKRELRDRAAQAARLPQVGDTIRVYRDDDPPGADATVGMVEDVNVALGLYVVKGESFSYDDCTWTRVFSDDGLTGYAEGIRVAGSRGAVD